MRPHIFTIVIALGLIGSRPAWAFRPLDFSDADVAESRTIEFELGPAEYHDQRDHRELHAPSLAVTFGLGGGYECAVEGFNRVALAPQPGERHAQISDASVALKKLVRRGGLQEAAGPSMAVEGELVFPQGAEESHLGIEASGVVSSTTEHGAAHLQIEVARSPAAVNEMAGGVVLETSDYRGWRPVLDLKLAGAHGEPPERDVLVGTIFEVHDGLAFDLGVNFGRSGDERWTEFRSGVTWQIGPRTTAPLRHWVRYHLRHHHH